MLLKVTSGCALLMVAFVATAIPQSGKALPNVRGADLYAVYSVVIGMEHDDAHFERYMIAERTITATAPMPGELVRDCLAVASDEAHEYEPAIADFEKKNSSYERLQPRLKLEKPYLLLSDADVASYRHKLAVIWGCAEGCSARPPLRWRGLVNFRLPRRLQ